MIKKLHNGNNIPQSFIDALGESSRMFDVKLYSDGTLLNYNIKELTIHKGACGEFSVGSVFVPYIELSVYGQINIPEELEVRVSVAESGEFINYIRVGYFYVTETKSEKSVTKCTAQGILSKMASDVLYETEPTNKGLGAILTALNTKYDVDCDVSIPSTSITKTLMGLSCREILVVLATCLGGYATEDNNGVVHIKHYSTNGDYISDDGSRMRQSPSINGKCDITSVKVIADDTTYSYPDEPEEGVVIEIENPYFNEDMFDGSFLSLVGLNFNIGDINLTLGDPRLEPWDFVEFTKKNPLYPRRLLFPRRGLYPSSLISYRVPCLNLTHKFNGGVITQISASAPTLDKQKTNTPTSSSDTAKKALEKAEAAQAAVNSAIVSVSVQYALSESETVAPESGWSETAPAHQDGMYMWQRTISVTKGGTVSTSVTNISGADGQQGETPDVYTLEWTMTSAPSGTISVKLFKNGVVDTEEKFLLVKYSRTIDGEPVYDSPATGTFTGTRTWVYGSDTAHGAAYKFLLQVQSPDPTEERVVASELASVGVKGDSITVTSIQYAPGNSPSAAPQTGWQNTPMTVGDGLYLWTRTTYSDNSVAYSVAKQGEQGSPGTTGRGISSAVEQWSIGTAQASDGNWSTTKPTQTDAKPMLWYRVKNTWSDGTITYTPSSTGMWAVLSVNKLSAITADMGTLTSGEIQVKASNDIVARLGIAATIGGVSYPDGIYAVSGKIGGFDIDDDDIHSLKSAFDASGDGVYIGTDGIALGDKFSVSDKGIANIKDGVLVMDKDWGYGAKTSLVIDSTQMASSFDYTEQGGPSGVAWQFDIQNNEMTFFDGSGDATKSVGLSYRSLKDLFNDADWVAQGTTGSFTAYANTSSPFDFEVSKPGYYAVGVFGWMLSPNQLAMQSLYINNTYTRYGSCHVSGRAYNHGSQQTGEITVTIYWKRYM